MRKYFYFVLLTILLHNFSGRTAGAQERKASITGHATDTNEDPLVGARVELQPLGQTATTGSPGQFTISDVPPGKYVLTVSYLGFDPFSTDVNVGNITSIWLTDQSQTENVAKMLVEPANASLAGIQNVLWGQSLKLMTNDALQDARIPDIVVIPNFGNIYVPADDKSIAAHGGFSQEDTNVGLLVSNPGMQAQIIKTPVETTQIAPTVLKELALNPDSLQAVQKERTLPLPGLFETGRFGLK